MGIIFKHWKSLTSIAVYVIAFLFVSSCSDTKTSQVSDQTVVATIGDRAILSGELIDKLQLRSTFTNEGELSINQKRSVLDELIQRHVQITAATDAGFATDPTIIAALENLMINKLRSEQLDKLLDEVNITPAEIELYYQQNIHKYTTPAMTRLAIIRFSLSSQASADKRAAAQAQAEQVYKLAATLPDSVNGFGSLAAKYSDHQASRYAGGDMGWIKNDVKNTKIDDAIIIALAQLKQNGDLAPLVEGTSGYYLLKLLDRREEKQSSLDKVGSNIKNLLERESRKQTEAQWLLSLQKNGQPVDINQDVLAAIDLPTGSIASSKQDSPPLLPSK